MNEERENDSCASACSATEKRVALALGGMRESQLWGGGGLIRATMECVKVANRVEEWLDMPADEMRLRCGEMTAQEIRTVRAVLNSILLPNAQEQAAP